MKRMMLGVVLAGAVMGVVPMALGADATTAPSAATKPAAITATEGVAAPLPAEVQARMVSLFDGKTLNGWTTQPRPLGNGNLAAGFLGKLSEHSEPLAAFIYEHLTPEAKTALETLSKPAEVGAPAAVPTTGKAPPVSPEVKSARAALLGSLNGMMMTETFPQSGVTLRKETTELLATNPTGGDLARANRAVLEDTWPDIFKPTKLVEWTVKEEEGGAAIASVGVGRGTLFTTKDLGSYRIIFDIRHVGSEPKKDHQACVLVFCMRPQEGEKFLDALGGVQFQVPNGGHWDYRPGFNNGGKNFTNVLKPKFNNHEWARCEILVNAEKGTAKMAVASPIGTKAVEVLDFDDAAAARSGPFALQMHNDGLYDEYRNIEVEENPGSEELVTTK
jgi:hypothetical protein